LLISRFLALLNKYLLVIYSITTIKTRTKTKVQRLNVNNELEKNIE
jgi:hypothetical protein